MRLLSVMRSTTTLGRYFSCFFSSRVHTEGVVELINGKTDNKSDSLYYYYFTCVLHAMPNEKYVTLFHMALKC